jgi:hypothetical protein
MTINLPLAIAQWIPVLGKPLRRFSLLFFGGDGASLPNIPLRFRGIQHREMNMKQLLKISAAPAAGLLALALVAMATPAAASPGEYCRTDVTSNMHVCSFTSLEECQGASAGRGGSCYRDPFLPATSDALAYQPRHLHSKGVKKPAGNL